MSKPICRHRPGFSGLGSAALLLLLGLAACQSDLAKPRPDAGTREAGSSDGSARGSDGSREAPVPADGGSTDGMAGGDLATYWLADAIPDLGNGIDLGTLRDGAEPSLDSRPSALPDAESDAPAVFPEPDAEIDVPSSSPEVELVDSGAGAGGDSPRADGPSQAATDGGLDSASSTTFDAALDGAVPDAPIITPDAAPDAPPDTRDAGLALPDSSPDGPADAAPDGSTGLDSRDGRGGDGGGGDGDGGPCCGCLCRDPSWSCSQDTCLDPSGHALTLAAESGFFELAGGTYVSENQTRTSPIHRIWYSFQPAATSPESKPLAVFFNGGPGSATSVYLFSLNTAPTTFDPAFTGTAKIAPNPNSWASFANLLYIDAPGTGFSYPLALAGGTQPSLGIDLDRDAGSVLRVVVRFLDRHPRLRSNPVIMVGESYGGTRSTLMLDHVLTYQTLAGTTAAYRDRDLYDDLVAHFAAVWPGDNPQTLTAAKLATQFGWQVLIQPVVAGDAQYGLRIPDTSMCRTGGFDVYQCNQPSDFSSQLQATVNPNLVTIATLRQALGVDPTTIAWMYASARKTAYGRTGSGVVSAPELTATFGALTSADNYLLVGNGAVTSPYGGTARTWHDSTIGRNFLADLVHVSTFITNAKYDTVVWTPAVAPALASFTDAVTSAVIDSVARTGIDRPGWIKVTYATAMTREIRFPSYSEAGHMVALRDPAHLLADVVQWYAASPHPSSPAHALPSGEGVSAASRPASSAWATQPASADPVLYLGP